MKQYISLMMVAARSRLWQVLLITAGACTAELLLFRPLAAALTTESWCSLSTLLQQSRFPLVFTAGLMLVCLSLASFGMERGGSKLGYTLRRLPCGEEKATLVFALHHFFCLLIYWGGQVLTVWYMAGLYTNTGLTADPYMGAYSPLLLFYECEYLHGLLPVEDWPIYIRNVVMLAALAMAAATCSYHWRRGNKPFTVLPLSVFAGLSFPADAGIFGLPGPGSDFVASLPTLYAEIPDDIMTALFHLCIFVTALIVVTYNLFGRARYVDT